jgi:hypothetical protein
VAISALVAAFFGANAYSASKKSEAAQPMMPVPPRRSAAPQPVAEPVADDEEEPTPNPRYAE